MLKKLAFFNDVDMSQHIRLQWSDVIDGVDHMVEQESNTLIKTFNGLSLHLV